MKAADIVKQLKKIVPIYTDAFSDIVSVDSLTFSGGIVTCVTSNAHGLQNGDVIFIKGALTPITINSLTRVGDVATAITNSNHDYTDGYTQTVTIAGADQPEYNGTHDFIHQPNRRTFEFSVTGSPVTPATGTNIYTLNNLAAGYNGEHTVTVIDDFTFTYPITSNPESPAQGTITMQVKTRISGAVSIDRIIENYTKQFTGKLWMWVVLGNTTTSKDRFTQSDATFSITSGQDYRQRIISQFYIYVAVPCSNDLSAMDTRDSMEDLAQIILKAVLNYKFTSPYSDQTNFGCVYDGHGMFSYDYAYYIHEFRFQVIYDLSYLDTVNEDTSVAFRDFDFGFLNEYQTNIMQTNVDLDDEPLN